MVDQAVVLGSTSLAGCRAARAKFVCRPSYHAVASEPVDEHNLGRLGMVATIHRPVGTAYACITPLSCLLSRNTPSQGPYNGGDKLGAITNLGDNLSPPPPNQRNYHFPNFLNSTLIPQWDVRNAFHMDADSRHTFPGGYS